MTLRQQRGARTMTEPFTLHRGDCIEVLRTLPDNSVDSIVTDPPYELGFMGKSWDRTGIANNVEMWREALRVLKPGGHLLAFSGSRTYHRMACAIEDAGFELRDQIMWLYGSGFPKSLDVSKAIDKAAGHARATQYTPNFGNATFGKGLGGGKHGAKSAPPVTAAAAWDGWGTALKPAHEPICVARKPLSAKTVAANVLTHSTGALNIDACRVAHDGSGHWGNGTRPSGFGDVGADKGSSTPNGAFNESGRWPANVIHDGSDEVLAAFPDAPGQMAKASTSDTLRAGQNAYGVMTRGSNGQEPRRDAGSAARFFYCAKASRADRNHGLEDPGPIHKHGVTLRQMENAVRDGVAKGNTHPTVKPTDLMAYLCRLVTPAGGVVLDPFMGSGSTGKGAVREGFQFIGIDMTPEYVEIASARITHELANVKAERASALKPDDQIDMLGEAAA